MKAAYVYVYCNEKSIPFYVGRGGNTLPSGGAKTIFAIEMPTQQDAIDYKTWLIEYFIKQGIPLTNKSANKHCIPLIECYVYVHSTPANIPFYVGTGSGWHAYNFAIKRTDEYMEVINKFGRNAIKVELITCKNRFFALELKQKMIAKYLTQGIILVNKQNDKVLENERTEMERRDKIERSLSQHN